MGIMLSLCACYRPGKVGEMFAVRERQCCAVFTVILVVRENKTVCMLTVIACGSRKHKSC